MLHKNISLFYPQTVQFNFEKCQSIKAKGMTRYHIFHFNHLEKSEASGQPTLTLENCYSRPSNGRIWHGTIPPPGCWTKQDGACVNEEHPEVFPHNLLIHLAFAKICINVSPSSCQIILSPEEQTNLCHAITSRCPQVDLFDYATEINFL